MEMEWENNPNNEKYTNHEFFQCVDKRFFIFIASFPPDSRRTDVTRILDSFHLVPE